MGAKLPYADMIDQGSETPRMQHIAFSRSMYWCGEPRDRNKPLVRGSWDQVDCIVCADLWVQAGGTT